MPRGLRLGLIGAGPWGRVYARTLEPLRRQGRLTHVATQTAHAIPWLPREVVRTTRWHELLRACDAVLIAVPPRAHPVILEACLAARVPCVIEKPLCLDAKTAARLARLARPSSRVLVNHTQLFSAAYDRLRQGLRRAGTVRTAVAEAHGPGPFRKDVPALWDYGPHDVSLLLDVFGARPQRVSAFGGLRNRWGHPERVALSLEFSGGRTGWAQSSTLASHKRRQLTVWTDRAWWHWDAFAAQPLTRSRFAFAKRYAADRPASGTPVAVQDRRPPMTRMLQYFFDGLDGGDRARFGLNHAVDVVRVLEAAERSLLTGYPATP